MSAGDFHGTYSAEKVIITIGGGIMSGFADGDFVTAKYVEDRYTSKVGADGGVGRSRTASKLGEITVTLSATSPANDVLSAMFNLDSLAGVNNPMPFGLTDLSGRTLCAASNAWLKTAPEVTFGKEVGDREWVFEAADLILFAGGNS